LKSYTIASLEGAQRYGGELGDKVELALDADQERALLAAGWLEEHDKSKKEANK
jgi:hypothetical protein